MCKPWPAREQCIKIHFSDPLLSEQDFSGLVSMDNYNGNFRFIADGNTLRAYPTDRIVGERRLVIRKSLKNVNRNTLQDNTFWDLHIKRHQAASPLGRQRSDPARF